MTNGYIPENDQTKASQRRPPRAVIECFANSSGELEASTRRPEHTMMQSISALPYGARQAAAESLNAVSSPQPSYQLPRAEAVLSHGLVPAQKVETATLRAPSRKQAALKKEDLTVEELRVQRSVLPAPSSQTSSAAAIKESKTPAQGQRSEILQKTAESLHRSYQRAAPASAISAAPDTSQTTLRYTYKPVYDVAARPQKISVQKSLGTHLLDDRWDVEMDGGEIKRRAAYYRERERQEEQRRQEQIRQEEKRLREAREERERLETEILGLRDAVRQERALEEQQRRVFEARRDYEELQKARGDALNQRDQIAEKAFDCVQMTAAQARLEEIKTENERLALLYKQEFEAPTEDSDNTRTKRTAWPTTALELIARYPDWELLPRDAETVISAFTERAGGA